MVVQLGAADVPFERGAVILSFDTEQIWGYLDMYAEEPFQNRYPHSIEVHENMLMQLRQARVGATWFLVGGLALAGSKGVRDPRFAGLPDAWTRRVPAGDEESAPLWYRRGFIERLRDSVPLQEIGIHGGLTHLIWTHPHTTPNVATRELTRAAAVFEELGIRATSFSYPRDEEAYPHVLADNGILCYRGRLQARAHLLGRTFRGRLLRMADEIRRASPLVVWPEETQPGLWNIPSSMFIYPLGRTRTRFLGLRSRVERFARGVEEAARCRGIFHFCLHPENLAEHPGGRELFGDYLEALVKVRDRGDVEVLTVGEMAARMEQRKSEAFVPAQGTLRAARSAPGTGTL